MSSVFRRGGDNAKTEDIYHVDVYRNKSVCCWDEMVSMVNKETQCLSYKLKFTPQAVQVSFDVFTLMQRAHWEFLFQVTSCLIYSMLARRNVEVTIIFPLKLIKCSRFSGIILIYSHNKMLQCSEWPRSDKSSFTLWVSGAAHLYWSHDSIQLRLLSPIVSYPQFSW